MLSYQKGYCGRIVIVVVVQVEDMATRINFYVSNYLPALYDIFGR